MALKKSTTSPAMEQETAGTAAGIFARWAGALLLAAALFAVAAIALFGTIGLRPNPAAWGFVALCPLSLLGWFAGLRQQERVAGDSFSRQRTLLGINAFSSVLLLAILLVGVNYIAARRHRVFDLTSNKVNSLSPQSHQALAKLPGQVTMTYVYAPRSRVGRPAAAVSLLEAYRNASEKVRVQYVDANREPARAMALNLTSFNTSGGAPVLLVESAGSDSKTSSGGPTRQEVSVVDEQNVTSALLKLIDPEPRGVYFLTGHGELAPAPEAVDRQGNLSLLQAALAAQNYRTKTFSLSLSKSGVPRDAAAIVVAGPRADLTATEEKLLRNYLTGKGRLLLLLAPGRAPLPRWNRVAQSLGVSVEPGYVIDMQSSQPQVAIGAVGDSSRHPLLRGVGADVALPAAVPMRVGKAPAGTKLTMLFESSVQSYAEVSNRSARPQPGPFALAVVAERGEEAGLRAVVVGNTLFATDQYFQVVGNASFFQAALNWLAGNDALVSIPPKPPVTDTLTMDGPTQRLTLLYSLFVLPILVLLAGTVVWWKRR